MDVYRDQLRRRSRQPNGFVRTFYRARNDLAVRARSVKSRSRKSQGLSSVVLDICQIILRFLSKPHILLLYVCAFAVVYVRSVSPDKDFVKRLAAEFPNNPVFSWAEKNFARFVGLFVFVPVFVDASPRVQPVMVPIVSVAVLMLQPQTALLYIVCAFSLHVYSKATSRMLKFSILAFIVFYMVSTNSFNVNSLFTAVSSVPSSVPASSASQPAARPAVTPQPNPARPAVTPQPKTPDNKPKALESQSVSPFRHEPEPEHVKHLVHDSGIPDSYELPPIVRGGSSIQAG
ncbi:p32 [Phellodendron-associated higre-like virus]|uniref:P32 n=1 Tax=Phellodendron-associated higre-like virus TaxID=3022218 RepID=A0AAT9T5W0_9VIRU